MFNLNLIDKLVIEFTKYKIQFILFSILPIIIFIFFSLKVLQKIEVGG
jgi:hypothetical protein